ncbi:hypothetical protein PG988_015929 [Apiospora saccharicola]
MSLKRKYKPDTTLSKDPPKPRRVPQAINDRKLRIAQVNVMGAPDRRGRIIQVLHKATAEVDRPWDVIAINDPLRPSPSFTRVITCGMEPNLSRERIIHGYHFRERRLCPNIRVAFYVDNSIPISDWYVTEPEGDDPNRGYVATLHLQTSGGVIHITNVYNHNGGVCIPSLMRLLSGDGFDLLVGDLNLLNRRWGGNHLPEATGKAKELDKAMEAASMKLLTPKGTTT